MLKRTIVNNLFKNLECTWLDFAEYAGYSIQLVYVYKQWLALLVESVTHLCMTVPKIRGSTPRAYTLSQASIISRLVKWTTYVEWVGDCWKLNARNGFERMYGITWNNCDWWFSVAITGENSSHDIKCRTKAVQYMHAHTHIHCTHNWCLLLLGWVSVKL